MASTWACARCSAPNEAASVSCTSCGAIRGSVVVSSDAATTAPGSGAGAPPPMPVGWPSAPSTPSTPPAPGHSMPLVPGAAAPGGWPGAPVSLQPEGKGRQVARGLLANVGVRVVVIAALLVIGGVVAFFVNAGRDASGTITKAGEVPVTDLRVGDCWDPQGDPASFDVNAVIEKTTGKPCTESHHYEVYLVGTISQATYPTEPESRAWAQANCLPAFEAYVGTSYEQSSLNVVWFIPDEAGWKQGDRGAQCSLEDGDHKALTQSMKHSGY